MQGRLLGIKDSFLQEVAEAAISLAEPCDPNVPRSRSRILAELGREEERFRTTLDSGEKVLEVCMGLLYRRLEAHAQFHTK